MAVSKTQVLPLRGNVVDLIQHHNWLLLAATHSEKKNMPVQDPRFTEDDLAIMYLGVSVHVGHIIIDDLV